MIVQVSPVIIMNTVIIASKKLSKFYYGENPFNLFRKKILIFYIIYFLHILYWYAIFVKSNFIRK